MPAGSSLADTNAVLLGVEKILKSTPEVESTSRRTGLQRGLAAVTEANTGDFDVKMKRDRNRGIEEVISDIRSKVNKQYPQLDVEFIQVLNAGEIEVRFWERGVGYSNASGTGSCGATVASILNGKTGRKVTVHAKAGKLIVEWPESGRLKLTSTANIVAEGNYLEA